MTSHCTARTKVDGAALQLNPLSLRLFLCLALNICLCPVPAPCSAAYEFAVPKPEFGESLQDLNVTTFRGHTSRLPCTVRHLAGKQVSWIRGRDLTVLSSGRITFASDVRISVLPGTSSSKRVPRSAVQAVTINSSAKSTTILNESHQIRKRSRFNTQYPNETGRVHFKKRYNNFDVDNGNAGFNDFIHLTQNGRDTLNSDNYESNKSVVRFSQINSEKYPVRKNNNEQPYQLAENNRNDKRSRLTDLIPTKTDKDPLSSSRATNNEKSFLNNHYAYAIKAFEDSNRSITADKNTDREFSEASFKRLLRNSNTKLRLPSDSDSVYNSAFKLSNIHVAGVTAIPRQTNFPNHVTLTHGHTSVTALHHSTVNSQSDYPNVHSSSLSMPLTSSSLSSSSLLPPNYLEGVWEPEDYTLQIKYTEPEDAGIYVCQVNTEPKTAQRILLTVVDMVAKIMGPKELFVKAGTSVTLVCQVDHAATLPGFIFWYKRSRLLDYEASGGRISVITRHGARSDLVIKEARQLDSDNYTCGPAGGQPASVLLSVIVDERPAAMQQGNASPPFLTIIDHWWVVVVLAAAVILSARFETTLVISASPMNSPLVHWSMTRKKCIILTSMSRDMSKNKNMCTHLMGITSVVKELKHHRRVEFVYCTGCVRCWKRERCSHVDASDGRSHLAKRCDHVGSLDRNRKFTKIKISRGGQDCII